MHRPQAQVRAWHQAMGEDYPERDWPDIETNAALRLDLISEEYQELVEAIWGGHKDLVIDAMCDLLFVIYGTADTFGIDLEPYFDEVVRSNFTKVGGPIREDGKRLKPDTYEPPDFQRVYDWLNDDQGLCPNGHDCISAAPVRFGLDPFETPMRECPSCDYYGVALGYLDPTHDDQCERLDRTDGGCGCSLRTETDKELASDA